MSSVKTIEDEAWGNRARIHWYSFQLFPRTYIGLCTTKDAFERAMAVNEVQGHVMGEWLRSPNGAMMSCFIDPRGNTCYLVSIDCLQKPSYTSVIGLLVHEVVHVVQQIFIDVGEQYPGKETEAYMIQMITQWMYEQYELHWKQKLLADKLAKAKADTVNLTQA